MNLATKKWILLKISSVILLPLMFWFIINFVKIYDNDYLDVVKFFTNPVSKFLFSLFIIFAYFFSSLTISEVFEDYITCLLYTSPSPRDKRQSRMPSSA